MEMLLTNPINFPYTLAVNFIVNTRGSVESVVDALVHEMMVSQKRSIGVVLSERC